MTWNILGHEWAVQLLQQHIVRDEVRHAYLFSGPAGVGRRTLALRFAQALNCSNPPAPGEPCGTCRTCQQIERMQHADLSVVQAESEGGVLKVEQVRELQHTLSLAPYAARYRVALLIRFQEANANAQNALLKMLEEAPPKVILLLTADSPESLLPTIPSRCEVLRLRPLTQDRLVALLQEKSGLAAEEARSLAHLSAGRIGLALRLHQQPELLEQRHAWMEDLFSLLRSGRRERFAYVEQLTRDREKERLRMALLTWQSFWRDLLVAAAGSQAPLINLDWQEEICRLAGQIDVQTARACTAELERALERLEANVNARLLIEVLLLDWPMVRGENENTRA